MSVSEEENALRSNACNCNLFLVLFPYFLDLVHCFAKMKCVELILNEMYQKRLEIALNAFQCIPPPLKYILLGSRIRLPGPGRTISYRRKY